MSLTDVSGYTDSALLMMHWLIVDALRQDDETPPEHAKQFAVREYKDWRHWSDSLEREADRRGVLYQKTPW